MARISIATDDFERADLGADWAQLNASAGGNIGISASSDIVNNNSNNPGAGGAARWAGAGSFNNDQYAIVTVHNFSFFGANFNIGPIVRASADIDGNRDYYFVTIAADAGSSPYRCTLGKVVNGIITNLHQADIAFAELDTLELEVEGINLRVFKNGVELGGSFTTTDSDLTTGKPGATIAGANTVLKGEDWEGGNIGAAGPTGTGTPAAQAAVVAGSGIRGVVGTGIPAAQASVIVSTGVIGRSGTGAPASQDAAASGVGTRLATVTLELTVANNQELLLADGSPATGALFPWEWYDTPLSTAGEPVDSGLMNISLSGESTVTVVGSALANGEFGTLIIYHPTTQEHRAILYVPVVD